MKTHSVGIIMNGVTGRMGTNQHLVRSILAIRKQGGVKLGADEVIVPEPILVGRNIDKLRALAEEHGIQHYTTDLDGALADSRYPVYFDATLTDQRVPGRSPRHRRGQAYLCGEAHRHESGRGPGAVSRGPGGRA